MIYEMCQLYTHPRISAMQNTPALAPATAPCLMGPNGESVFPPPPIAPQDAPLPIDDDAPGDTHRTKTVNPVDPPVHTEPSPGLRKRTARPSDNTGHAGGELPTVFSTRVRCDLFTNDDTSAKEYFQLYTDEEAVRRRNEGEHTTSGPTQIQRGASGAKQLMHVAIAWSQRQWIVARRNPLLVLLGLSLVGVGCLLICADWGGVHRKAGGLPVPPDPNETDAHRQWWGELSRTTTSLEVGHVSLVTSELNKMMLGGTRCAHARQIGSQSNIALIGEMVVVDFATEPTMKSVRRHVNHTSAPCGEGTYVYERYYDEVVLRSGPMFTDSMDIPGTTVLSGADSYCAQYMDSLSRGRGVAVCRETSAVSTDPGARERH